MYCNNCGSSQQDTYGNYCIKCGAPLYQPVPAIKRRNIVVAIILTFVTCGIYGLIWMASITDDMNVLSGDYRTSGGMAVLYTFLTCGLYSIYWAYRQGEKLDYAKQSRGIASSNSNLLYMILEIIKLRIVGMALMQNEVNRFATM